MFMNIWSILRVQAVPSLFLGLIIFGAYSTFIKGHIPFFPGVVVHNKIALGLIWCFFSTPQLYIISGRINAAILSDEQRRGSVLVIFFILIPIYLYSILLNTTSWFHVKLPIPFLNIEGGILVGLVLVIITTGPLYKAGNLFFEGVSNKTKEDG